MRNQDVRVRSPRVWTTQWVRRRDAGEDRIDRAAGSVTMPIIVGIITHPALRAAVDVKPERGVLVPSLASVNSQGSVITGVVPSARRDLERDKPDPDPDPEPDLLPDPATSSVA